MLASPATSTSSICSEEPAFRGNNESDIFISEELADGGVIYSPSFTDSMYMYL